MDNKQRRSLRLKDYDYASCGAYFVTACVQDRKCLFGDIKNDEMHMSPIGKIIHEQWHAIPQRFPAVKLDAFVVMPDHIHGILLIDTDIQTIARVVPTVGDVMGAYKSLCAHHCLAWVKQNQPGRILGKLWQRNFYEHVVRDEDDLLQIQEYIVNNPLQWNGGDHEDPGDRNGCLYKSWQS